MAVIARILPPAADDLPDEGSRARMGPLMSPAEAVDAAVAGQAAGWDALFDRYYPVALRVAMARLGDRTAAEEVAQEVFVSAVGTLGTLRERSAPAIEAWFVRIAARRATDAWRRARPTAEIPAELTAASDPVAEALQGETAVLLRAALDDLTDEQREVVVRRFVLDQSLEEVGAATGRPVGAVKSMQHRALAALARALRRRDAEDVA